MHTHTLLMTIVFACAVSLLLGEDDASRLMHARNEWDQQGDVKLAVDKFRRAVKEGDSSICAYCMYKLN
jgi:hypothetical protein